MQQLPRFEEAEEALSVVKQWRKRYDQALVFIDQFEELFSLSAP